jgi:hypothetical protein
MPTFILPGQLAFDHPEEWFVDEYLASTASFLRLIHRADVFRDVVLMIGAYPVSHSSRGWDAVVDQLSQFVRDSFPDLRRDDAVERFPLGSHSVQHFKWVGEDTTAAVRRRGGAWMSLIDEVAVGGILIAPANLFVEVRPVIERVVASLRRLPPSQSGSDQPPRPLTKHARPLVLTGEMALQLNRIRASEVPLDLDEFPDFFLIGPPRTASSWLWGHLSRHPQVFMTTPKETFFFAGFRSLADVDRLAVHEVRHPSKDLSWYLNFFHESSGLAAERQRQCAQDFGTAYAPVVRGEASTAYAASVSANVLSDIVLLNPDIKAISLLRHPVERAWSSVKFTLGTLRDRKIADIPHEEITAFLQSIHVVRCGLYSDQHSLWRAFLRPEHLFTAPFDDVVRRPKELLGSICRFLGIDDAPRFMMRDSSDNRNESESTGAVPEPYRSMLREMFQTEIARQRQSLGVDWS